MNTAYDELVTFLRDLGDEILDIQQTRIVGYARKQDRSILTSVDIASERKISEFIRVKFPNDGIVGEEGTDFAGSSGYLWLIDPIDGTRQFVRDQIFWGILVARLNTDSTPVFGAIYHPSTKSVIAAERNSGCFQHFPNSINKRLQVTTTTSLDGAYISHNGIQFAQKAGYLDNLVHLCQQCDADRGFGDSYGHIEVIAGRMDGMIDVLPEPHDIAAVKICVEEAGGQWVSVQGGSVLNPGPVTLTTNGLLAPQILEYFRGPRSLPVSRISLSTGEPFDRLF